MDAVAGVLNGENLVEKMILTEDNWKRIASMLTSLLSQKMKGTDMYNLVRKCVHSIGSTRNPSNYLKKPGESL